MRKQLQNIPPLLDDEDDKEPNLLYTLVILFMFGLSMWYIFSPE